MFLTSPFIDQAISLRTPVALPWCDEAPAGRFEPKRETECVTVELYCFVHIGHELDHVSKLCSFHFGSLH